MIERAAAKALASVVSLALVVSGCSSAQFDTALAEPMAEEVLPRPEPRLPAAKAKEEARERQRGHRAVKRKLPGSACKPVPCSGAGKYAGGVAQVVVGYTLLAIGKPLGLALASRGFGYARHFKKLAKGLDPDAENYDERHHALTALRKKSIGIGFVGIGLIFVAVLGLYLRHRGQDDIKEASGPRTRFMVSPAVGRGFGGVNLQLRF